MEAPGLPDETSWTPEITAISRYDEGVFWIPSLENKKVSWFLGKFYGFLNFDLLVSKLQGFPQIHFMFLIDIDPISKISNKQNGSSSLFGACLFEYCQNMAFRNFDIYKKKVF